MKLHRQSSALDVLAFLAGHPGSLPAPQLHAQAKALGKNHTRAAALWRSGDHRGRLLAALTDAPELVTRRQMQQWAGGFDSWMMVDCTCCYLFACAKPRWQMAVRWSSHKGEFQRRAAFALMAYLAYKDKHAANKPFRKLLPLIERAATDPRHFVKKAVNWALRNIGKRNRALHAAAIQTALRIRSSAFGTTDPASRSAARWIASDALRELQSPLVQRRLRLRPAGSRAKSLPSISALLK